MEVRNIVQEVVIKTIPKKKKCKKAKWLSEEDLQVVEKRREVKGKGEKERYTLIPSAQRFVWAAKQALGKAALGALFAWQRALTGNLS